jgi:thiol-disulfide isomerase/thioredoxin
VAAACSSSEPASTKPTFGGGTPRTIDADELSAAKAQAGIDDCPVADGAPAGNNVLPDVTLACLGGGPDVNLAGLAGTPTVINLWASWCKPCREELPLLAKVDQEFGDALQIIGIDYSDPDPDKAIELARLSGVTYPQLVDRDEDSKAALKVVALPQTVFVDAQGTIVATERKEFRSYAELTSAIEQHLGVTP